MFISTKGEWSEVKNIENTLDILSVLWENIVLEVPIRFSEVSDYYKYQGNGWHLVSEEEYEKEEEAPAVMTEEELNAAIKKAIKDGTLPI